MTKDTFHPDTFHPDNRFPLLKATIKSMIKGIKSGDKGKSIEALRHLDGWLYGWGYKNSAEMSEIGRLINKAFPYPKIDIGNGEEIPF